MNDKGKEFKGTTGGAGYDRLAAIMGMRAKFYKDAVGNVEIPAGAKVLELGCGTGSLGIAAFERSGRISEIHGVDLSSDQLRFAKEKTKDINGIFNFHRCSMDKMDFSDQSFDLVMTCMALHETPPDVRRGAIREASRVLKTDGSFVLVDWSKPRFGLLSLVWMPFLFLGDWQDNWKNTYCTLCREQGLFLEEDQYVNSLSRRQVFRKQ